MEIVGIPFLIPENRHRNQGVGVTAIVVVVFGVVLGIKLLFIDDCRLPPDAWFPYVHKLLCIVRVVERTSITLDHLIVYPVVQFVQP